jgi:hypothetical protein
VLYALLTDPSIPDQQLAIVDLHGRLRQRLWNVPWGHFDHPTSVQRVWNPENKAVLYCYPEWQGSRSGRIPFTIWRYDVGTVQPLVLDLYEVFQFRNDQYIPKAASSMGLAALHTR